ncbi:MAG TPA: HEAT repeat domain-containing protein [Blastocatellia bacterium]|nr:HEAT repeat domain-containing protein [Blastocatellia bacterium]
MTKTSPFRAKTHEWKSLALCFVIVLMCLAGCPARRVAQQVSAAERQDLKKLNRFLRQSDSSDPATKMFLQGRDYLAEENWAQAEQQFNNFLKEYSNNAKVDAALYWLALSQRKQDQLDRADQTLQELIRRFPKSTWVDDAKTMRLEIAPRLGKGEVIAEGSDSNNDEIKAAALRSLFEANPDRGMELARNMLKPGSTASPRLKEAAVQLAGSSGGPKALAFLEEIARNSQTDIRIRKTAVFWLGQSGDESVLELLKDITKSTDTALAEAAVFSLSQHSSPRVTAILGELARSSAPIRVRNKAIFGLSQREGEESLDELIKLYDSDHNPEIQKQILFALAQLSTPRAQSKLNEIAMKGDNVEVRKQAIFWIGQRGGPDVAENLIKLYDSASEPEIRKQILFALSQMHTPRADAKLDEVAGGTGDVELRKQAIFWMGQGGGPETVERLIRFYDSEKNEAIKEQIIFSLNQSSEKTALVKLMDIARNDNSPRLKRRAIFWIGQRNDPESLKFLEEILK